MIQRYTHDTLEWIDVCNPTPEEVREIMESCSVDPVLLSDVRTPTPQSRSQAYTSDSAVKLTLDFPVVKHADTHKSHEIKFIVSKKHLITIRYEDITAFHQFAKEFEVLSLVKKVGKKAHAGHLFIACMDQLYRGLESKLDYIDARIEEIDDLVFQGKERQMVTEISLLNRRLISFQLALSSHKHVLTDVEPFLTKLLGTSFDAYVKDLQNYFEHLSERLYSLNQTLTELRETNNALLTTKQNEIIKNLTIIAFVTLPLSLFTSIFGMNTKTLPIVGNQGDFWVLVGIMAGLTIALFAFFKYKHWL